MPSKNSRVRQVTFLSVGGLLLAGFVAAQTLPFTRGAAPGVGAQSRVPDSKPAPTPAAPVPDTPTRPQPSSVRREIARYEDGGQLSFVAGASRQERDAVMAQARGFILKKWQGRQLGRLALRVPDAHGRETVSAFYIEPDESGRWCVVLETDGGTDRFGFVEEIELPSEGPPIPGAPLDGPVPPTSGRGLHLKETEKSRSGLVF